MKHEFDTREIIDCTATLYAAMGTLDFDASIIKTLVMRYPDRTETWVSDGEEFTKKLTDAELVQQWAEENCEFGEEYRVRYNTLREAYSDVAMPISKFFHAMKMINGVGNSDGHYTGLRLKRDEVQALADQLAQPWPEHVYKIHYNIEGNNCYISKDELEYEWWILPAALGGERNTLAEAAYAVAEIVVGRKQ